MTRLWYLWQFKKVAMVSSKTLRNKIFNQENFERGKYGTADRRHSTRWVLKLWVVIQRDTACMIKVTFWKLDWIRFNFHLFGTSYGVLEFWSGHFQFVFISWAEHSWQSVQVLWKHFSRPISFLIHISEWSLKYIYVKQKLFKSFPSLLLLTWYLLLT